jgi:hypothetical protein
VALGALHGKVARGLSMSTVARLQDAWASTRAGRAGACQGVVACLPAHRPRDKNAGSSSFHAAYDMIDEAFLGEGELLAPGGPPGGRDLIRRMSLGRLFRDAALSANMQSGASVLVTGSADHRLNERPLSPAHEFQDRAACA